MASGYVRALQTFCPASHPTTVVHEGDVVLATAAIATANPTMFENLDTAGARAVPTTWRMHVSGD